MRLAVVCPTRGRPEECAWMIRSALDTSDTDVLLYADEDDERAGEVGRFNSSRVRAFIGPPIGRGQAVNDLCERFRGYDAYLIVSDDITFVRNGWDAEIEQAFALWPDKIGLVHLASENGERYVNWACVSRQWIDALGWFNYPGCRWFCQDTILQTLAEALGRITFIERQVLRHKAVHEQDVIAHLKQDQDALMWFYARYFAESLAKLKAVTK